MIADVSVVIPYYEAKKTIRRALKSIADQTLQVKEIIIVNDGSVYKDLLSEVADFSCDLNINCIDLGGNFGAANARNVGVLNSLCKYIAFLDADDIWDHRKIEVQYGFMNEFQCFLSCHGYVENLNSYFLNSSDSLRFSFLNKRRFILGNPIHTPTVMVERDNFIKFDVRLSRSEDLKCWISNIKNGDFCFIKNNMAGGYKNAVGESGLSGSFILMHKEYLKAWRILFDEKHVNFFYYITAILIEKIKFPIRIFLKTNL